MYELVYTTDVMWLKIKKTYGAEVIINGLFAFAHSSMFLGEERRTGCSIFSDTSLSEM